MSENNLTFEDYKKIVDYYKAKCVDLEYKYVLLQVDVQRILVDKNKSMEEEINKRQDSFKESQKNLIESYQRRLTHFEAIIENETDRVKTTNHDGETVFVKKRKNNKK